MTTSAHAPSRAVGWNHTAASSPHRPAQLEALKKRAFDLEQQRQFGAAIAAYREIIDIFEKGAEPNIEVGLYNRLADLLVRQGETTEAVSLLERAADLYVEGGFVNKAIALCNKVLRTVPERASVLLKLGRIHAAKGLMSDARRSFLDYADRMQQSGEKDESIRALKEFADLTDPPDEIRPTRTGPELVFIELGAPLMEKPRSPLVFLDVDAPTTFRSRAGTRSPSGAVLTLSA